MFGNNVSGEIILASIPKDITAPGGGNAPIIIPPGSTGTNINRVMGDGGNSGSTSSGDSN
ncbi:MAG: hypothetical protein WCX88_01855 [Patescibacteria group bacterium]